jgi:hypothetical protein
VTIKITDANDEDPIFQDRQPSFTIDTSFSPGGEVGRVLAVDADLSPFNETMYKLESSSSFFSVSKDFGTIILDSSLSSARVFQLNISAFNPGRETQKDTITATLTVNEAAGLPLLLTAGIAGGAGLFILLIIIIFVIILCVYCKNRHFSKQYSMKEIGDSLNNVQQQHPILKMPIAANNQQGQSRVTFKESVEETHYIPQSVVIDTGNTIRKESITKFDASPQALHQFDTLDEEEEEAVSHNPTSPKDLPTMVERPPEVTSPTGHMMNGSIPPSHHMHGSYNHGPHSPIVHVVTRGPREEVDFSQNTSSDGHTYIDDEESMFSDDASIINASIVNSSLYSSKLDPQYRTPPNHSPLELHLPPITHGQPTSSSLAQLHAYNLAQLSEANRQQQYTTSEHERSLTLTPHDHLQHASISTQSTRSLHSPQDHTHSHMGMSDSSSSNHIPGRRNYPHPLVMPEAFPSRDTGIHQFPMAGSYADYGESTCASADLDDALGSIGYLDVEPGIVSLTAEYEDTEL